MRCKILLIYAFILLLTLTSFAQHFDGPLRRNPSNPRYFTDNSGKAIYLTGSHTWENLQDMVSAGEPKFDYPKYLEMMAINNHNFMRMWVWEQAQMAPWSSEIIVVSPLPFERTGPGLAKDNKPKFDLTRYNTEYFERLRQRVMQAGEKGIYVSVMLFQGWSQDRIDSKIGNPFPYLPYHAPNNVNKINAPETPEDYDDKPSLHSMLISHKLLKIQEAYVKKVIETLNDLDNVLYEIINEGGATEWQYHMIKFIKSNEQRMPKQHPVGMTHRGDKIMTNQILFEGPADWISPNYVPYSWTLRDSMMNTSYKVNPPQADGSKVIINDTDHLWGHGGNHKWVWKSFLRGLNPIFMDPWDPLAGIKNDDKSEGWLVNSDGISKDDRDYPDWDLIRKNMGYTLGFAKSLDLNKLTPHSELSTTTYCLSNPGLEYLIYFPESTSASVDLSHSKSNYKVLWFIPLLNRKIEGPKSITGGSTVTFEPPTALDAVLYLSKI